MLGKCRLRLIASEQRVTDIKDKITNKGELDKKLYKFWNTKHKDNYTSIKLNIFE